MAEIHVLPLSQRKPPLPKHNAPSIHTATALILTDTDPAPLNATHGIVGGYRISAGSADVTPVIRTGDYTRCFIWDGSTRLPRDIAGAAYQSGTPVPSPAASQLQGNHCNLLALRLDGPEVRDGRLSLSAHLTLELDTADYAARLGVITLVEAQRFITLDNGGRVTILDSQEAGGPVLYLQGPGDTEAVTPITRQQAQGSKQTYDYALSLAQDIPDDVDGAPVETVTVLEQYRSYLMQHPLVERAEDGIWAPVAPPITWGWSIRVGRHADDAWCIVRRKLIMPTVGHDGLELPLWTSNTLRYANPALT